MIAPFAKRDSGKKSLWTAYAKYERNSRGDELLLSSKFPNTT